MTDQNVLIFIIALNNRCNRHKQSQHKPTILSANPNIAFHSDLFISSQLARVIVYK